MMRAELAYSLSPDDEPEDKPCPAFAAAASGSGRTPAEPQRGLTSMEAASATAGTASTIAINLLAVRDLFDLPRVDACRPLLRVCVCVCVCVCMCVCVCVCVCVCLCSGE